MYVDTMRYSTHQRVVKPEELSLRQANAEALIDATPKRLTQTSWSFLVIQVHVSMYASILDYVCTNAWQLAYWL